MVRVQLKLLEFRYAVNIHQADRSSQTHRHHGHHALAACNQFGLSTPLAQ